MDTNFPRNIMEIMHQRFRGFEQGVGEGSQLHGSTVSKQPWTWINFQITLFALAHVYDTAHTGYLLQIKASARDASQHGSPCSVGMWAARGIERHLPQPRAILLALQQGCMGVLVGTVCIDFRSLANNTHIYHCSLRCIVRGSGWWSMVQNVQNQLLCGQSGSSWLLVWYSPQCLFQFDFTIYIYIYI